MKTLTKTFLKIVSASIASIAILTTAAAVSAEGDKSARTILVQGTTGLWTGTFESGNVMTYYNEFNDPKYYSVVVNGKTTKITAKNGCDGNYKWASVTLTGRNGNTYYGSAPHSVANNQTVTATASYNGNDTIEKGYYYAYIYHGTTTAAQIMESSGITVILK